METCEPHAHPGACFRAFSRFSFRDFSGFFSIFPDFSRFFNFRKFPRPRIFPKFRRAWKVYRLEASPLADSVAISRVFLFSRRRRHRSGVSSFACESPDYGYEIKARWRLYISRNLGKIPEKCPDLSRNFVGLGKCATWEVIPSLSNRCDFSGLHALTVSRGNRVRFWVGIPSL